MTRDVRSLEQAIKARPGDVATHHELAVALQALDETELVAIARELPFAFTTQLFAAALLESRNRRAAVIAYLRAIKTAQVRGFWFDEPSTPEWLRAPVLHAMDFAGRGKIELFDEQLAAWNAVYGRSEMTRVTRCLAMWLGLEPRALADPRQRPTFLYFPDLPVHPVFPRDALPFAESYEVQADAIRAEALRVLHDTRPFHYDVPEAHRGKLTRGEWDAYFFYDEGEREDTHHAACPATSAALSQLPLDHVRDHGPEVCFSVMRPGAHNLPHRGVTNTRAVLHLGLVIPAGRALKLTGAQEGTWERGKG